jgi:two-component system cell cycle response regulator
MATILIIEDNAANLELMQYLLKSRGCEPLTATDGQEGLRMAGLHHPDLIICDIQLPKIDGYEIVRRLKSDASLRMVPVVAVTAFAMVGDREKIRAAGFDGCLTKPIDPEQFADQIEAFLKPCQQASGPAPSARDVRMKWTERADDQGVTILVLDNTADNRRLMCRILNPAGYTVVAADTVSGAMALAHQQRVDLIISDLHLDGESGYDFLRAVKNHPDLRSIPFLFLSSTSMAEVELARALRAGATKFLSRPIDPARLLAEIESCLVAHKAG